MVNSVFNTKREEGIVYAPEQPGCWENGYMMKHRYLAQMILGRPIKPEEVAIHKDGNKDNNKVDNIMVFATKGMGIRYHKTKEGLRQREDHVWEFDCMYGKIGKEELEDFLSDHTINETATNYHKSFKQIVDLCKEYNIEVKHRKQKYIDPATIKIIKNNIDELGVVKTAKLVNMSTAFLYTVMRKNNIKYNIVKRQKFVVTESILQKIRDNINVIGIREMAKLLNIERSSLYKIIKNNGISCTYKRNNVYKKDDELLKTIRENVNEFSINDLATLVNVPRSSLYKIMKDNNIKRNGVKVIPSMRNGKYFIDSREDVNEIIEYLKKHNITETSTKFDINTTSLRKFMKRKNISYFMNGCNKKIGNISNDENINTSIIESKAEIKAETLQEAIKLLEQKYNVVLSIDKIHSHNISKASLRTELILDNSTISEVAHKYHVFDEDVEFLSTKYHLDNESIKHKNLAKNVLTKTNIEALTNIGYGIEDIANMYKIGTLYVRYAMIFNK